MREKLIGKEHPNISDSMTTLGGLYLSGGQLDKALSIFENSLKIRLKTFGEAHELVADSLNNIGRYLNN